MLASVSPPHAPALDEVVDGHVPVMLSEVLETLAPRNGGRYVDGTFGGGSYARAILRTAWCSLWGIDRDPTAIARGQALCDRLESQEQEKRLHMVPGKFGDMASLLAEEDITAVDGIVLDLGVSSFQIDEPERGFSFRADGPLDMRMSSDGLSAESIVNRASEAELADIFYHYGEERHSRRVARAIVAARAEAPIKTTLGLAEIVRSAVPADRSGIDPATRTFQGLRIRVNDELGQIENALDQAFDLLAANGRLVVVSFHSLEDRIVKRAMLKAAGRTPGPSRHAPASMTKPGLRPEFQLVSTKALRPTDVECKINPRARSARLRAIERVVSPGSEHAAGYK